MKKMMKKMRSNMCDLPEELVMEVLLRVAAEMATRLRCVSKSWKTLIDSPEFRQMRHGGITHLIYLSKEKQLYMTEFMDGLKKMTPPDVKIEMMGQEEGVNIDLVGSCNGLLCLLMFNNGFRFNPQDYKVVVMNPRTKQSVEIPKVGGLKYGHKMPIGFGYDNVNDDYKVVRLSDDNLSVYSFRSKRWSDRVEEFSWQIRTGPILPWIVSEKGIFANGTLHWIRFDMDYDQKCVHAIVAFDLATEKFNVFPLPSRADAVMSSTTFEYDFGEIDGCLSLLLDHDTGCDVWMMKEYGMPDSWTKLSLRRPNPNFKSGLTLLSCNFDARRALKRRIRTTKNGYYVFRARNHKDEIKVDDLVLWKPRKWEKVFTFTSTDVSLPLQN